ncbi:MAG: hypothetical protein RLZZ234_188 [Candidatus Parcubacteria bacterium]|jgi:hypothetical protein
MTLSAGDTQMYALVALFGAVFAFGKALDVLVDVAVESLTTPNADIVHRTCVQEGTRTTVKLYHRNGSGTERTTDFIGNFSTVRERTFLWKSDDRGVPREWIRQ